VTCDTRLKPRQTIQERATEVREAVLRLATGLRDKRIRMVIHPVTGAVAFAGWDETSRDGITDACAYRTLARTGGAMFQALLAQAAQAAGRPVDLKVLAGGLHSHDGGASWHKH